MADFTGFYFNNIHSSTYGLIRTSNGDRYSEGLIPEFQDHEIELVGGDGSLYGGRTFKKIPISIPVVFDHMTEKQFRDLREWLSTDELKELRFDERPYKAYWVKPSSRPTLEYLCFMEEKENGVFGEQERIYKGEGTLEFTAYDPFGYCIDNSLTLTKDGLVSAGGNNWQSLGSYSLAQLKDDNVMEWAEASGLKSYSALQKYNHFVTQSDSEKDYYTAKLYNPGDKETDFQLFLSFSAAEVKTFGKNYVTIEIISESGEDLVFQFSLENLSSKNTLILDTKKHSLTVYNENQKSLRYDLIKSFKWVKIPKGESEMKITCNEDLFPQIKYNYKYY